MYQEIEDKINFAFGPLTNFEDVAAFMLKFGLAYPTTPTLLDDHAEVFRLKCLREEINELEQAWEEGDLAAAADALVDLVYFALGTAYMMGIPWQEVWAEVQAANMRKVRSSPDNPGKRGSALDVVKPPGWVGPDVVSIIAKALSGTEVKDDPPQQT